MGLPFVGGPYDGMVIDHELLNAHAQIQPISGEVGTRLFALLPPREDWDRGLRGEAIEPKPLYAYERQFGDGGAWFQAAAPGAVAKALSESRLTVHPRARTALSTMSPPERRRVIEAADALQHEDPAHWPTETVVRLAQNQSTYLLQASPELRVFIRVLDGGRIELFDVVREDTLRQFLESTRHAGVQG